MKTQSQHITRMQAAKILGVSTETINAWANKGILTRIITNPDTSPKGVYKLEEIEQLAKSGITSIKTASLQNELDEIKTQKQQLIAMLLNMQKNGTQESCNIGRITGREILQVSKKVAR